MRYYLLIVSIFIYNNIFAESYFSVERLFADINRTQKKINFCDFESSVENCNNTNYDPSESSTYYFEKDVSQSISYSNLSTGYVFSLKKPHKVNSIDTTFNPMFSIGYNFGYLSISMQKNNTFLDSYGLAHGIEILFMDDYALSLLGIKPVFEYREITQANNFIPTYLVGKNASGEKHLRTNAQFKAIFKTWGGSIGGKITKKSYVYFDLLTNEIQSTFTLKDTSYKLLHKNAYSIKLRFLNLN